MTDAQTEARAIAQRLERAVKRAEEHAGMMPARQAVKLHPNDWHAVCDLAREAATALEAQAAELEKVKAECDKWREAFGEMHRQTMRAEAQLAEANKALDRIIAKNRSIVGSGRQRVESDGEFAAIARRAREQGGE